MLGNLLCGENTFNRSGNLQFVKSIIGDDHGNMRWNDDDDDDKLEAQDRIQDRSNHPN
jgi:hypothetical protein